MVYQRLTDLIFQVDSLRPQQLKSAFVDYKTKSLSRLEDQNIDIWAEFISLALTLAPQHRARYQALNILLPKVGAARLLLLQPTFIETLLVSSMRIRDISSSVSSFISTFLYSLVREGECLESDQSIDAQDSAKPRPVFANRHGSTSVRKNKVKISLEDNEINKIRIREIWSHHVVASLCSNDPKQRDNSADYLLASVLEFDPHSSTHLVNLIRAMPESVSIERKLWGLVNIVLQCRMLAIEGPASQILPSFALSSDQEASTISLAPSGSLLAQEAYWACMSNDVHLRLTTFGKFNSMLT
jgi:hypothetical protein